MPRDSPTNASATAGEHIRSRSTAAALASVSTYSNVRPGHAQAAHNPEDDDLIDLTYGEKINLRAATRKYAIIDGKGAFVANSINAIPLVIINAKHPRDRGPVRFQDVVCLYNSDGQYLSSESNGVVNGRRTVMDTRIKWTLLAAPQDDSSDTPPETTGICKIFDRVALKSCFGTYLTYEEDGSAHSKGQFVKTSQKWHLAKANLPFAPEWLRRRMYELAVEREPEKVETRTFNQLPVEVQEQLLLEDLLSAMMAIEGKYLRIASGTLGTAVFRVDPGIKEQSLINVLTRILPVCSHYAYVSHYVNVHARFEYGLVNHAFTGAIRRMLKEYLILVAQLEHQLHKGSLTLLRAWFYIQPSLRTMERLNRICSLAASAQGGSLLNVIHTTMGMEGDSQTRALYQYLISEAAVPYFSMLQQWVYHGVVDDPYGEFQIKSREELRKENLRRDFNDTYWDERYTVRTDKLPVFLEAQSEKILTTGKYLNVIRECGLLVTSPHESIVQYTPDDRVYSETIDKAYSFASRDLLQLLVVEKQLLARLTSIKRYFLLNQGDFFVHFMDIADEELQMEVTEFRSPKLESLLELALRTSNASTDPFKDDLNCYLQQYTLMQKLEAIHSTSDKSIGALRAGGVMNQDSTTTLKRLEGFTLEYKVRWPLSLIISKKALTKYQLIFRHLFYCKHVERQLNNTWRNHQSKKELELGNAFRASYVLRHRMLGFLQNLAYYMMVEVLGPNWHTLEEQLKQVETVDQVLLHHNAFLDQCLRECLLTNQALLKILRKLMSTCLLFASNIQRFTQQVDDEDYLSSLSPADPKKTQTLAERRKAKLKLETMSIEKVVGSQSYVTMIERFVGHFDTKLDKFLTFLRDKSSKHYDHHLANLYTRLDYNGYYSEYFKQDAAPSS